jgi:endonuclease/exonuclease/phosphatase family metal-dependent hydrolase
MRIATWNLERPKPNSWLKNPSRTAKIAEVDADLWVLTETSSAISIPGYEYVSTQPTDVDRYPGENFTTIWSRWPIIKVIHTNDPEVAVCAEIDTPAGPMILYGTIITYANDGVNDGGYKRWEKHRQSIRNHAKDWRQIQQQFPHHHFCIAGDFNQSRDGSGWYADPEAVTMLTTILLDLSLDCKTGIDLRKTGKLETRASVDHICLSRPLAGAVVDIGAWEGTTIDGTRMSDHNGVFVDVAFL